MGVLVTLKEALESDGKEAGLFCTQKPLHTPQLKCTLPGPCVLADF